MNKKIMLGGLVVLAGFITLTAFGGKTLEQQKQEIAAEITAQLDEFRAQKQEECTIRINEEGQRRYDEFVASLPTKEATKYTKPKSKPKGSTTTKKDPLPQTTPTDPQKTRGGAIEKGNVEEQKKRGGAIEQGGDPVQNAEQQKKRGGAVKKEGGK
jgi:phenylpyruvate tautomerase PptA (4-oxalocrotonate tautomerase family)